jgi:hypothetical protein
MRTPVRLGIALSLALVMIASAGIAAATSGSDPVPVPLPVPAGQDSVTGSSGGGSSMPGDPGDPGQPGGIAIAPEEPCGQTSTSGTGPDASVSYTPCPGEPTDPIGHAQDVVPTPGMSDVGPIGWIKAVVGPDDRTVTLRFWSGVEPCYVLDHVDVAYAADGITVTLFQGSDPSAQGVACIEIAMLKQTTITLDQPLAGRSLLDGAKA